MNRITRQSEINVVAIVKGSERWVFIYDDANKAEIMRQLGRWAANPELSFSWYDAAVASQRVRGEKGIGV